MGAFSSQVKRNNAFSCNYVLYPHCLVFTIPTSGLLTALFQRASFRI